ncbi:MAG: hypothetical protein HONBIEJF_01001 [Fimbriimonadaceae bacterium]|nr:hypothetical protein [Fimbriimonadaceae bacterium]
MTFEDYLVRAYQEGDGAALFRAVDESREHLRATMPWIDSHDSPEASEAVTRQIMARFLSNQDFGLGIWNQGHLVGGTGFHMRVGDPETANTEVGLWIHASHAGKGLGKKVLRAMLEWGFTEWGWYRIVWKCDSDNLASAAVARSCGLVEEGRFRQDRIKPDGTRIDTLVFAILAHEWRIRR